MGVLDDARRERFRRPKVMSGAERIWRVRRQQRKLDEHYPRYGPPYGMAEWEARDDALPSDAAECRATFEDLPHAGLRSVRVVNIPPSSNPDVATGGGRMLFWDSVESLNRGDPPMDNPPDSEPLGTYTIADVRPAEIRVQDGSINVRFGGSEDDVRD